VRLQELFVIVCQWTVHPVKFFDLVFADGQLFFKVLPGFLYFHGRKSVLPHGQLFSLTFQKGQAITPNQALPDLLEALGKDHGAAKKQQETQKQEKTAIFVPKCAYHTASAFLSGGS